MQSENLYLTQKLFQQELLLAEGRADNSRLSEDDLEGLLAFAESMVLDPASFWLRCTIDQKQRLQQLLFPEGLQFADGCYRTATTCLLFTLLRSLEAENKIFGSPDGDRTRNLHLERVTS